MAEFERLTIDGVNQVAVVTDGEFDLLPVPTQAHITASVETGGHWQREGFRQVYVNTLASVAYPHPSPSFVALVESLRAAQAEAFRKIDWMGSNGQ